MSLRKIVKYQLRAMRTYACAASFALVAASPVAADYGGFSISLTETYLNGGAVRTSANLQLPDSGNPAFFFHFALPPDYKSGEAVQIALYLQALSAAYPCKVVLQRDFLSRRRPGLSPKSDLAGLRGRREVNFPAAVQLVKKIFSVGAAGAFPGQRRGDAFSVGFYRDSAHPADTCDNTAYVRDIMIIYPRP
jgi:hypothetical protein